MKVRYPRHEALYLLLKNKQYDACLATAQEMIARTMALPAPEAAQSAAEMYVQVRDRDRELACLHIFLARALFGLSRFSEAADQVDIAAFLGLKVNDHEVLGEALYLAGAFYSANGEHALAIRRLDDCLACRDDTYRAEALHNKGFSHLSMADYASAVADFEVAIAWELEHNSDLVQDSRRELAWALVLARDFERAERLLEELESESGADSNETLRLQIAHDRLHMSYLKGHAAEALQQAHECLKHAVEGPYSHVRAYVALTLMRMAIDKHMVPEAVTLGVLAKRLAGQAHRSDLDEEAGRHLWQLERREGTDSLIEPLLKMGQVSKGTVAKRRQASRVANSGGVA